MNQFNSICVKLCSRHRPGPEQYFICVIIFAYNSIPLTLQHFCCSLLNPPACHCLSHHELPRAQTGLDTEGLPASPRCGLASWPGEARSHNQPGFSLLCACKVSLKENLSQQNRLFCSLIILHILSRGETSINLFFLSRFLPDSLSKILRWFINT